MSKRPRIKVRKRFQRSVNLISDFTESSAVRDFVVSPLAWETVCRLSAGFCSDGGNRAWGLIGPYGSGKSSFAAFFANLVAPETQSLAMRRIRQSWREESGNLSKLIKQSKGLLPIPIVGERAPLAQILLQGLETSIKQYWATPGRPPAILARLREAIDVISAGRSIPDSEIVSFVQEAAQTISKSKMNGDGLCIILDEFGKTLEWAALHASKTDLYLLQLLAEAANRKEKARFMLITIQHQGLDAYADRLSLQQQREWEKVSGRFETIPYLESPRHLVRLVAEAIESSGDLKQLKAWGAHQKANADIAKAADGDVPLDVTNECFPLHPATALCLGPIFRLNLGQNERSLFSFLSSREPQAFQAFLFDWHQDMNKAGLLGLGHLYDYIIANTRALLSNGPDSRIWATAEEAIRRLPKDSSGAEAEVVKTVTILSLIGRSIGLAPSKDSILACCMLPKTKINAAINKLEQLSIIVFRKFKNSYQLWDGSDLDVAALVNQGREAIQAKGDIARQMEEVHTLAPFLAARHFLEKGTLRTFECRFVSGDDHVSLEHFSGHAGGLIALVLPERNRTTQTTLGDGLCIGKPILSLRLDQETTLVDSILDFLGSKHALETTAELENDPIAKRSLNELHLAAWDKLQEQLTLCFHGQNAGRWRMNGQLVDKVTSLSEIATLALNAAYSMAPVMHNELLNREVLSSAASGARRRLSEGLLLDFDKKRLGIEKTPAELSMYLSIIEANQLHQKIKGEWTICAPPKGTPLAQLWAQFDNSFKQNQGQRVSLQEIYTKFSEPPFGIRAGVLPVLMFCYILVNRNTAFLYEDGTFVPTIEKDHVQRFLSRPHTFEVQKLALNNKADTALTQIRLALGLAKSEGDLLPTVKALYGALGALSPFARQTQRISAEAKNLRAALMSSRDPMHLLCEATPSALGVKKTATALRKELTPKLKAALIELSSADTKLALELKTLMLQAFSVGTISEVTFKQLRQRAEAISLESFPVQPLARIVLVFSELADEEPGEDWFRQFGLALVGKPVLQWRDEDMPIFRSVLFDAARQFAAAEAGSIDMRTTNGAAPAADALSKLTSLAWLTTDGDYETVVAHITPAMKLKLGLALPGLRRIAEKSGFSLRELLASALVEESSPASSRELEKQYAVEV
jgi:hypothetical protein